MLDALVKVLVDQKAIQTGPESPGLDKTVDPEASDLFAAAFAQADDTIANAALVKNDAETTRVADPPASAEDFPMLDPGTDAVDRFPILLQKGATEAAPEIWTDEAVGGGSETPSDAAIPVLPPAHDADSAAWRANHEGAAPDMDEDTSPVEDTTGTVSSKVAHHVATESPESLEDRQPVSGDGERDDSGLRTVDAWRQEQSATGLPATARPPDLAEVEEGVRQADSQGAMRLDRMASGQDLAAVPRMRDTAAIPAARDGESFQSIGLSQQEGAGDDLKIEIRRIDAGAAVADKSPLPQSVIPAFTAPGILNTSTKPGVAKAVFLSDVRELKGGEVTPDIGAEDIAPFDKPAALQSGHSAALHRTELPRHVAAQLTQALRGHAQGPVELTLQPEELGKVRMTVSAGEMGVVINISADRPETFDMMRRHAAMLSRELGSLGFGSVDLSFDQGPQADRRSQERPGSSDMKHQALLAGETAPETPGQGAVSSGLDRSKALDIRI